MAAAGVREDESISVVDEGSSPEATVPGGPPEFRMYTGRGAEDEDASHYALNLSYQVLQRRNRDLEQQLGRVQRDNARYRRRIKGEGEGAGDMDGGSLSPLSSPAFRARGASASDLVATVTLGNGEAKAQAEYTQFLEKQLQKRDAEGEELAVQVDQEKARALNAEQKHRSVSNELGECLEIVASRSKEIEELIRENERINSELAQFQAQANEFKSQKNIITILNEKRRELETKVFELQGENASIHQMYEDSATKCHRLEKQCAEYARRQVALTEVVAEREEALERLGQVHQTQLEQARFEARDSRPGAATDTEDMQLDDNTGMLEETKQELSNLQQQVLDMHRVIQTQTRLIQELGNKLRQKAVAPLSGAPFPRPRAPQLLGRTHQADSPSPLSSPVLCDEDLRSLPTENSNDFHTLTDWATGASASRSDPRVSEVQGDSRVNASTSPVLNKRVPVEQSNVMQIPSANMIPRLSAFTSSRNQIVGVVANRDTAIPAATRPFNFSAQAVLSHSNTDPLIRHPPTLTGAGRIQGSATEPLPGTNPFPGTGPTASGGNPFRMGTPGAVSREPNYVSVRPISDLLSPQVVRLPERTSPGSHLASPMSQGRTPTEQSDLVVNDNGPPKLCPICNKMFTNVSQGSFEYHVNHCLDTSETAGSSPVPLETAAQGDEMRECPVCSQVYPPGISVQEFETHVDTHFVEDRFEVLGS